MNADEARARNERFNSPEAVARHAAFEAEVKAEMRAMQARVSRALAICREEQAQGPTEVEWIESLDEVTFLEMIAERLWLVEGDAVYEPWIQRLFRMAKAIEAKARDAARGWKPEPVLRLHEVHAEWCPFCGERAPRRLREIVEALAGTTGGDAQTSKQ